MVSRTAKFASSLVAGVLAGTLLTAPRSAANAAECLTEPGKNTPQGEHWYYRIEQGTKRHCWYTRAGAGKVAQAAASDDAAPAANEPATPAQGGDAMPHSLADAHAEYPMPQGRGNAVATPAPAPAPLASSSPAPDAPRADAQASTVASRWPSPETALAPPATAGAAPAVPLTVADATDPVAATKTATDAPSDASDPAPTAVAAPPAPATPSVSLQMLLAVLGGALALAGLTASIVYRLGRRGRQRRLDTEARRAVLWEGVETAPTPVWLEAAPETAAPRPIPDRRPVQGTRPQERYEKIEEILAQLVKQGQQSDA